MGKNLAILTLLGKILALNILVEDFCTIMLGSENLLTLYLSNKLNIKNDGVF